jgi:hypothetical protein
VSAAVPETQDHARGEMRGQAGVIWSATVPRPPARHLRRTFSRPASRPRDSGRTRRRAARAGSG